jgi:hypothetical protein
VSKNIYVLGIDPGGTTGMTVVHVLNEVATVQMAWQIDCSTGQGLVDCGLTVESLIRAEAIDKIAIERFNISGRTVKLSRQYEALYIIGIVKYLVGQCDVDFVMQNPADAKTIWGDRRIDWNIEAGTLQLEVPVKKPHAYDSLRHALLGAKFVGTSPGTDDTTVLQ